MSEENKTNSEPQKARHIPTPPRDRMIHRAHAVVREQPGIRGTFHVLAQGEGEPKHTTD